MISIPYNNKNNPKNALAIIVAISQGRNARNIGIVRYEDIAAISWHKFLLIFEDNPTMMNNIGIAKLWPHRGSSWKSKNAEKILNNFPTHL